jgi:hypothetical protein
VTRAAGLGSSTRPAAAAHQDKWAGRDKARKGGWVNTKR